MYGDSICFLSGIAEEASLYRERELLELEEPVGVLANDEVQDLPHLLTDVSSKVQYDPIIGDDETEPTLSEEMVFG